MLVNMCLVRELEGQWQVLSRNKMKVNIQGIGKCMNLAWQGVRLRTKLEDYLEEDHNFVVLEELKCHFVFFLEYIF